ncbi:MAG: UDP-glucose--hexose-1-phosphate uridylyltransferase [Bacilli bacterium]
MINQAVSGLINFYLKKKYIKSKDIIYCINNISSRLHTNLLYVNNAKPNLYESLELIVNYAIDNNVIEDYFYQKDSLESEITNIFLDKPSVVQENFESTDPIFAYKKFYNQCIDSNYIKLKELKKNVYYKQTVGNNQIEISINLAKPEKDPKEIAKLKKVKSSNYPKCPLCIENVGYAGSINQSARINHRVIELKLNNQDWFFQYSPYLYYDFHCILIEKQHNDMHVTDDTIKVQIDFVDKFSDFFIGNNAALPIVGGSILNHNHFQGGIHKFAINFAKPVFKLCIDEVEIEYLDWHLATIQLRSKSKASIISKVNTIKNNWESYSDKEIINNGNNALNFISRKSGLIYEVIIILRNNSTSSEYPNGVYHPNEKYFHLKKENIGLIEAMGFAVLPARLVKELEDVKLFITQNKTIEESIHYDWAKEIKEAYQNQDIDEFLKENVAKRFVEILKCCNVFKNSTNIELIIDKLLIQEKK